MKSIREKLMTYFMDAKAKSVMRRLNTSLNFPMKSASVKKVMVILPRDLAQLDQASTFVQSLRKTYPGWRIELFDVDKLNKNDLNRIHLPKTEIIGKLKDARYNLVLDLNIKSDQLSAFITLMTEAPYRLHVKSDSSPYYNIIYQSTSSGEHDFYESLLHHLRKLFVLNGKGKSYRQRSTEKV